MNGPEVVPMSAAPSPLGDRLAKLTREGDLYERLPGGRVLRAWPCGHAA